MPRKKAKSAVAPALAGTAPDAPTAEPPSVPQGPAGEQPSAPRRPGRKAAQSAVATAPMSAEAVAPATERPAGPQKPGRKKAVASAPLLDLAGFGAPAEVPAPVSAPPTPAAEASPALDPPAREPVEPAPAPRTDPEPTMDAAGAAMAVGGSAAAPPAPAPAPNTDLAPPALAADGPAAEPPAPAPAPVATPTPAAPSAEPAESMAERAARYRQRFVADDKPVARRPPPPPIAPPPRLRAEPEAGQGPRRALSMAEIAERQRAARSAAREPEVRPAVPARAAPESMQDRALRFRPTTPEDAPPKPAAPPPIAQRPARAADGLDRAAHATHHRPADSVSSAPAVALDSPSARAIGVCVVLVTRNHAPVIAARLGAWRQAVPDVDVRMAVLDLGSTDDTVAAVEEDSKVTLASCPGGLADPLRALAVAVRAVPSDIAVLVEAGHPPGPRGVALVQAARAGQAPPWLVAAEEGVVAVPAGSLRKVAGPPPSLSQWAGEAAVPAPPSLDRPADWRHGFVAALLGRRQRRRDQVLALLPWPLRPVAGKLAGLLAGP